MFIVLFNKLKFLGWISFGLFLAVDGWVAAHGDFENYTLTLKGCRVPDPIKPSDCKGPPYSGRYELTQEGKYSRLPWHSEIKDKTYYITIPRAWVEENISQTSEGKIFHLNLFVMPYSTGYAETEPFLNTHIDVLFPDNSPIEKYKKVKNFDLYPSRRNGAFDDRQYQERPLQGGWED